MKFVIRVVTYFHIYTFNNILNNNYVVHSPLLYSSSYPFKKTFIVEKCSNGEPEK